jgi:hypothetical protein
MDKKDFELIIKNLTNISTRCTNLRERLDKVGLQDLSVAEYNKIVLEASQLQGEQDKVCRGELYHILGMGNLTVTQQATFISKVKETLKERSLIKFVASQPKVIIGKQETQSEYNSSLLGKKLVKEN